MVPVGTQAPRCGRIIFLNGTSRRARARGDREPGQAAAQQEGVHAHGIYDLECDTTATSPMECALRIKEFLAGPQRPVAFDRLRSALLGDQRPAPESAAIST